MDPSDHFLKICKSIIKIILKNNYHSDFYVHKNYQQEKYRDSNLDFDNHTFLNPNYYCTNCKFMCSCDGDIDKYECLGH